MEVALVLLGFGLSLLTQFATREWVRKDKAKEQHEARMDRYRDQLRVAISEFVSSAASFLLEAHASTGLDMGIQIIKDQDLEVPNELASKGSKAFDDLIAASHSMETKAVSLLLLLGETSIRHDVHFIAIRPWDSFGSNERKLGFLRDMQERRTRLNELTKKLAGLFVPQQPEDESADGLFTPAPRAPELLP